MVRHGRQVHAQPFGDRGVGVAGVGSSANEARQVERRQAVALLILCHLRVRVGRRIAQHHGHFSQACAPCRAPTLGAEVDAVTPLLVGGVNDERLEDAVLANVLHEFVDLRLGKLGARIVGVFAQQSYGQRERFAAQRGPCRRCLCVGCGGGCVRNHISRERCRERSQSLGATRGC